MSAMGGFGESPGSIRNQVGRSLNIIRDWIDRENVDMVQNHVRYLVSLVSPILEGDERKSLMAYFKETEDEREVYEDCMNALDMLLPILAERGYYARVQKKYTKGGELALVDEGEDAGEIPNA